jgi:mannose-6-phosphate isomerase-like protein (cupin superfamily)
VHTLAATEVGMGKPTGWALPEQRGTFFQVETESEHCQTARMTLAPGADGGEEKEGHPGDQVRFVAEGEVMIMTAHEELRAKAGTVVVIPPRTSHRVRNVGAVPALLLNVYTPPAY